MNILGINYFSHDVSSALLRDGKIISAAEEERFVNKKHVASIFPKYSMEYALKTAKIDFEDIDVIVNSFEVDKIKSPYGESQGKIFLFPKKFLYKRGIKNNAIASIATNALRMAYPILWELGNQRSRKHKKATHLLAYGGKKITDMSHHLAHASSAFRCSNFKKSNILVIDGKGETEGTSLFVGNNNDIELIKSFPAQNSFGALYSRMTMALGLGDFGEGKLMGLGPYGKYNEKFDNILILKDDDYEINWLRTRKIAENYQRIDGELTQDHKDIAFMLQYQLEKLGLHLSEMIYEQTGYRNFCLAGGCALNCPMNSKILNLDYVNNIFIQPASTDGGVSLGAVLEMYAQMGYKSKLKLEHAYLGPEYSNEQILEFLKGSGRKYEYHEDICGLAAELLSNGKVIGWFHGRMEYGPRALGNRSILADPRNPDVKDHINKNVKHREMWRPLAPSILIEKFDRWVENPQESPFMLLNFQIKENKIDSIPSVVHVDGSSRIQTVDKRTNRVYHKLIGRFNKLTGVPVILNTSLNDKGMPIARTPMDAMIMFDTTKIDFIIAGNYLISR